MELTKAKPNIRALSNEEIEAALLQLGEPKFRAKQIADWLWHHQVEDFNQMLNLPVALRDKLSGQFSIPKLSLVETQKSADGTIKHAFKTFDGHVIEGVLIPTPKRMTACISSQVGCSLTCKFCATGKLKRLRNLTADEIFDQVALINQTSLSTYGQKLTNIVYMGMGEPLLNLINVLKSVDRITDLNGLGFAAKRITVSTAGIAKMIEKLGDLNCKFNLALSLHAANEEKRSQIMPINDQNALSSLKKSLRYYYDKTGLMVTYEYIIFKNFNDTLEDAAELMRFCGTVPSKVNIIEYNPIDEGIFQQAETAKVDAFANFLKEHGILAKVRRSRGKDIDAACGQLANKNGAVQKN